MKKTLVLYNSYSGFTEKYAQWISQELGCDCFSLKKTPLRILSSYQVIIFGGPLHATGIGGLKKLNRRPSLLKKKELFIFATGASPGDKKVLEQVMNKNLSSNQRELNRFYYFRGGYDHEKLPFPYKFIMGLMRNMINKKSSVELTPDEKGMKEAFLEPVDFTKKETCSPLIEDVRKIL